MDRKRIIDTWGDGKKVVKEQQQVGVVSSMLCQNIARPVAVQGIIQFEEFAELDRMPKDADVSITKGNKPVTITNAQAKIIYALSQAVTAQRGEERMRAYIDDLNNGVAPKETIICNVNLRELAKKIQPNNAKQDDIDKLAKEVLDICEIDQSLRYGDDEVVQPFLIKKMRYYKHTKDGKEDKRHLEALQLEFAPIFFFHLGTGFAMIPDKLFEVWGKKGTRSDLFVNLLSQLFSVYGNHHSAYEKVTREIRLQNKNRKAEDVDKLVSKAQRDALMYSELSTTIQSRTTTDYKSSRVMKSLFVKDMLNICAALKELGLITDYKQTQSKSGERWDFWFNPDYNKYCERELAEGK